MTDDTTLQEIGVCGLRGTGDRRTAAAAMTQRTGPTEDAPPDVTATILRRRRARAIALSEDREHVAMVNPEDGTLSVFQTRTTRGLAKVATGGYAVERRDRRATTRPRSSRIAPTARSCAIAGIDGGTPAIDATIEVGAEPTGLALSPTGKKLFVAEYAESRVSRDRHRDDRDRRTRSPSIGRARCW